ncbi:DNA starvation/stationary phase protection protein [Kribbella pittospori]|uniref:DNA starvation/stationary phase protection protein n=1 Tax=Kribbella pittospori TaxID=722689 RepID=A0A4R0JUP5_9ACTN|nr:DNA starvation/stationary phase protection protein [Kribbella pittospori]TCC50360.1 DNA starvation/stationary phase protection protein [Kribbella pittospori]
MDRNAVGKELEPLLIELIDLALTAKQAHWNVSGLWFRPLHLQLDELADDVRNWSDDVAERLSTIGLAADGRLETLAKMTPFTAFPDGFVDSLTAVPHMVERLNLVVESNRTRIDRLGALDLVSQDLVISVTAGLEKHRWMFAAEQSSKA